MNMTPQIAARFFGIAFITVAAIGSHAFAATLDAERSQAVKFDDVNMNSPAGLAVVYKRIHQAAERVCKQPGTGSKDLGVLAL